LRNISKLPTGKVHSLLLAETWPFQIFKMAASRHLRCDTAGNSAKFLLYFFNMIDCL